MGNDGSATARAERFERERPRLRALAQRLLGSSAASDDAVQETWLRLARSDAQIDDLAAWTTTVLSRICLDELRSSRARRERLADRETLEGADAVTAVSNALDPEEAAVQADCVSAALLFVLDSLSPTERLAFILHDVFAMPFEQVSVIVDRSVPTARQLASRARRRVRAGAPLGDGPALVEQARHREIVDAFLDAARNGEFARLLELLDPGVVLRADATAVANAAAARAQGRPAPLLEPETTGADAVARVFAGRAAAAHAVLVDGAPGFAWLHQGEVRALYALTFVGGRISGVDLHLDSQALARYRIEMLR